MIDRKIANELKNLANNYRVVTITGPRQAGKTTLCKMVFPELAYLTLEDPDIRAIAEQDPREFFRMNPEKLIIDEIQRVPSLLSYIQTIVDKSEIQGQFILTGSYQLELNEAIIQSLAGRTALLSLLPLSFSELKENAWSKERWIHRGFMPAIHQKNLDPTKYYRNYFQTYVERDVRQMINLKDLSLFETFVRLCAGRIGQLLNVSSLANDIGVTSNTVKQWLSILESSFIIVRLQPYFENLGKRLVKTPKLYFTEVGLAAYLLGIEQEKQVFRGPLRGNLFENLVVMEMIKARSNLGLDPNLYFYRDKNGNEIDIIYKYGHELIPVEFKSAETFENSFLKGIKYFKKISGERSSEGFLIYSGELTPKLDGIRTLHFSDASETVLQDK